MIFSTGIIFFQSSSVKQMILFNEISGDYNSWNMIKNVADDQMLQDHSSLSITHQSDDILITIENRIIDKVLFITTAVCGVNRINESIVMIKSAILFSKTRLKFIIFVDEFTHEPLNEALQQKIRIKASSRHHDFEIRPMQFPSSENGIDWKSIFRPCACQRLFFPVSISFPFFFLMNK
jgi:hypothetical protein